LARYSALIEEEVETAEIWARPELTEITKLAKLTARVLAIWLGMVPARNARKTGVFFPHYSKNAYLIYLRSS
jgi:hypothetical protein